MASVSHKRALSISAQSTPRHAFALISESGKDCSPHLGTHSRPGSHGSMERLRCAKAVEDTTHSTVASLPVQSHPQLSGSSEAAPAPGLQAVRLCWMKDCWFMSHQEEISQWGLLNPTLPGRDEIQLQTQRTSINPGKLQRPRWGNAMSYQWTTSDMSPSASSPRDGKRTPWHSIT